MFKNYASLVIVVMIASCSQPLRVTQNGSGKNNVPPPAKVYREAYTSHWDLAHTRLELRPDWKKKELKGKATLFLRPHFYESDSVVLNAKGMMISEISLLEGQDTLPLKFEYDSLLLVIHLNRKITARESVRIFIAYTARPEALPAGGSDAIREDKGLYFINPDSLEGGKPTQLWTQGETESNSVWFPTIENPQQRMTQEIYLTVDTAFVTLSNGLLISSVDNRDGTKTDYWKQSLPAAPYLTMIAAGNFSVISDRWKNIHVNYLVDPPYAPYARMIFGNTSEMISFFSDILGVEFPWEKYSQVVVHEYVSGAMENTTAVVHGTNMQQDSASFRDGNYEDYISHELFHHWFGDLVTCESWSNITLNEGFANYAEYLWREHKYGRDDADRLQQEDMSGYLITSATTDEPLIRYEYDDAEDLYDAISYNKGGRVLHMLRKLTGDSAFFASLNYYLTLHKFGSVEVHDLRQAFEKITGRDLNWFFEQWFFKPGYPSLNIDYSWNEEKKLAGVIITQKQNFDRNPLFRLPMRVDIYSGGRVVSHEIEINEVKSTFTFPSVSKPDLVNVDAEKMLLCKKIDNKTPAEYIFQYDHAPLYLDRFEAVSKIGSSYRSGTPEAAMMIRALSDPYYAIRARAVSLIGELAKNDTASVKNILTQMAISDSSIKVRDEVLLSISKNFSYTEFKDLFTLAVRGNSYMLKGRAFKILSEKDPEYAASFTAALEKDSDLYVVLPLSEYFINSVEDKNDFFLRGLRVKGYFGRYQVLNNYEEYLLHNGEAAIIRIGTENLYRLAKSMGIGRFRAAIAGTLLSISESVSENIAGKTSSDGKNNIDLETQALKNKIDQYVNELTGY